jgi:hypothetical protein
LLPQAELTLNHLRPWSLNPSLSAYHGLHSEARQDGEDDSDRNTDNGDTESVDSEGKSPEQEQEETKTDSKSEECEGEENERGSAAEIGETVVCGDDDPLRKTWTKIGDITVDARTEPHSETVFKNLRFNEQTTELDIFWR